MVDQNSNSPTSPSSSNAGTSPSPTPHNTMATPTVVKAGEMMLIFALVLIFLVCFFVALHFYLKRRKQQGKGKPKDKKEKKKRQSANAQQELHSEKKEVAELVGTPICEMGESEPRHEMEDVEVHEMYTTTDAFSHMDLEAGRSVSSGNVSAMEPEERPVPVYWSARL